jgi:cytochrome c-type biogenesis protein CcmF
MVAFDPSQRRVVIRVDGLNLPVDPAKAVVSVSLKPLVQLVWLGVIICALGGVIAIMRRSLEGRVAADGRRVRLPRGLAGLARLVGR